MTLKKRGHRTNCLMISFSWGSSLPFGKRSFQARRIALLLFACVSLGCKHQHPLNPYVAYVLNQQSATLMAVNLAEFRVTASLSVSPQPERVLLRPHGRQLYVVSGSGKISVAAIPRLRL